MPIVFQAWYAPAGEVASVQYGTVSIAATATSGTATITSVDTTKSIVIPLGITSDSDSGTAAAYDSAMAGLVLTNATTVTATRNNTTGNIVVSFVVVVWNSVKSIQTGNIDLNGVSSNTATITSVDTTKSIVINQGNPVEPAQAPGRDQTRLTLTNATTVTATLGGVNTGDRSTNFAVVEFL